ncbi:MAG: ABC transporter substrate-binding protein [Gammaproteobacteria bacterium]
MIAPFSLWRRAVFAVLVFGATLFAHAADFAIATDTPEATIATLQRGLIALSQRSPRATVDERYKALEPLIVATHDLPYIAEFALRRQWPQLAEADRARFVAAFQRLSVMTYAARFVNVSPNTFRPIAAGAAPVSGRAQVTTGVARVGQPDVSFEYLLQQGSAGWRIANIVADGVSDLALKRAEYQRILGSGTLDTLIKELEAQTERLRQR